MLPAARPLLQANPQVSNLCLDLEPHRVEGLQFGADLGPAAPANDHELLEDDFAGAAPWDASTTSFQRLASSFHAISRSADLTGPARVSGTSGPPSRTGREARMSAAGTAAPRWPRPRPARPRP